MITARWNALTKRNAQVLTALQSCGMKGAALPASCDFRNVDNYYRREENISLQARLPRSAGT
jgi:hypothetical protein